MSEFNDFGGLISTTGSVGGGSGTYAGNRGILFPEFDKWASQNNIIMKTSTDAKMSKNGISETITMDIDFADGLWRPASTILGNDYLPSYGDEHPTIEGCFLNDVSIRNYNGQPDHFRAKLDYKYPEKDSTKGGGSGGGGGDNSLVSTPLDDPFLINFTPNISQELLKDDLDGNPIVNPNGEPYELYTSKVRLDGVCTWNQYDWDEEDVTEWTNIVNSDTWVVDEYKFNKNTILLHYVVGNVRFFTDEKGRRIKYYAMSASISFNPEGWNNGIADENKVKQRRTGSFYYTEADQSTVKHPKDLNVGDVQYDLTDTGYLKSGNINDPTVQDPEYDEFKLYTPKKFNFVDLSR